MSQQIVVLEHYHLSKRAMQQDVLLAESKGSKSPGPEARAGGRGCEGGLNTLIHSNVLKGRGPPKPINTSQDPLGPCGPGPCRPPWALAGRALVGLPGPLWARPLWLPWALMGRDLLSLCYKKVTLVGKISR